MHDTSTSAKQERIVVSSRVFPARMVIPRDRAAKLR